MPKRFTNPTIKWAELAKLCPPDQKGKFIAFKGKSDGYLRRVQANPPEPPEIKWAEYKKLVPVKGLVDKFKSKYEALKVPFPKDTLTSKVDEQWKALQPEIKAFNADRDKDISEAQSQIKRIQSLPDFDDMTMEMFKDMYPNDALDPLNNPTFWPHNEEEQLDYAEAGAAKGKK